MLLGKDPSENAVESSGLEDWNAVGDCSEGASSVHCIGCGRECRQRSTCRMSSLRINGCGTPKFSGVSTTLRRCLPGYVCQ